MVSFLETLQEARRKALRTSSDSATGGNTVYTDISGMEKDNGFGVLYQRGEKGDFPVLEEYLVEGKSIALSDDTDDILSNGGHLLLYKPQEESFVFIGYPQYDLPQSARIREQVEENRDAIIEAVKTMSGIVVMQGEHNSLEDPGVMLMLNLGNCTFIQTKWDKSDVGKISGVTTTHDDDGSYVRGKAFFNKLLVAQLPDGSDAFFAVGCHFDIPKPTKNNSKRIKELMNKKVLTPEETATLYSTRVVMREIDPFQATSST